MMKKALLIAILITTCHGLFAQFNLSHTNWKLPNFESSASDMDQISGAHFALIDMDGDRDLDLVDTENDAINSIWDDGTNKFWKVYLNTGRSFDFNAVSWTIPRIESSPSDMAVPYGVHFALIDMDGDGDPDLVDTENDAVGSVWVVDSKNHWKVYENTGTSFSSTAGLWEIPRLEGNPEDMTTIGNGKYGLIDINDDGLPDLIDAHNDGTNSIWNNGTNRYWKVYLNQGSSFNLTAEEWVIPRLESQEVDMAALGGTHFSLLDIDGDGTIDIVDTENDATGEVWVSGSKRSWKVYTNNRTAFSSSAIDWELPRVESGADEMVWIGTLTYGLRDIDGDGDLDMIDTENDGTGEVWESGSTRYWKVHLNNGSSFNSSGVAWSLPLLESGKGDMDKLSALTYAMLDIDGDTDLDLIDTENDAVGSIWEDGGVRAWRVYENSAVIYSIAENATSDQVLVFPNPAQGEVTIQMEKPTWAKLVVRSMSGQMKMVTEFQYLDSWSLNLDEEPGLYILEIQHKDGTSQIRKLVVE